ncbi:MAG: flagellin [Verrucomicrobiota bacterium]|nr:flagellin [Verrucomicrobiota bacterium]
MPITINTNTAANYANFHLGRNQSALQKSLTKLSSGSRITQPIDDAGGLAVSLKLQSAITRLDGAQKNVQNAISFLEVQDGVLESAGKIMNRMIELKGLSTDVMKNSSDNANYNREFRDLQQQLFDMGSLKFNGISLFATTTERNGGSAARFNNLSQNLSEDNTVTVVVSSEGNAGPKVSVNKSLLFSALTIRTGDVSVSDAYSSALNSAMANQGESNSGTMTFVAENVSSTINLTDISVGVFTQAVQNIATLRADNGASMSRLRFAAEEMGRQQSNLEAANGRIVDVDIAAESTRLAKYNVLVQASASMLAQANTQPDIALMLLR